MMPSLLWRWSGSSAASPSTPDTRSAMVGVTRSLTTVPRTGRAGSVSRAAWALAGRTASRNNSAKAALTRLVALR